MNETKVEVSANVASQPAMPKKTGIGQEQFRSTKKVKQIFNL
jgi:hypothetical protein